MAQDTIIKLSEEHAASGLPVGLDVASGDSVSPEMSGIWWVGACVCVCDRSRFSFFGAGGRAGCVCL